MINYFLWGAKVGKNSEKVKEERDELEV